jgi:hypothetical protein
VGTNPDKTPGAEPWDTVDFRKTIENDVENVGLHSDQVAREVQDAAAMFYQLSKIAQEHKLVIEATRRAKQRASSCM